MNSELSQQYDDEIKLTNIIQSIWNGKWIISGVTAVTSIITVIYLMVTPQTYTGELKIFPISVSEALKYEELNSAKFTVINGETLQLLFLEDLMTYKSIEASIVENKYLEKIDNETEKDFFLRVQKTSRRLFLFSKDAETENYTSIFFTTFQPDLALKVISNALISSNNNVKIQLESDINRSLDFYSRDLSIRLEDIEILLQNLLKDEKLKTLARLAFLKEQTAIAKTLNLKTDIKGPVLITVPDYVKQYHLHGYVAIDKEIELLSSRESPHLFIDEFIALEKEKKMLLQDQTIVRTKEKISLTPINTDKFKSVSYDKVLLDFKGQTKSSLMLVISIILGGIIGIFVLIIRNIVTSKV